MLSHISYPLRFILFLLRFGRVSAIRITFITLDSEVFYTVVPTNLHFKRLEFEIVSKKNLRFESISKKKSTCTSSYDAMQNIKT